MLGHTMGHEVGNPFTPEGVHADLGHDLLDVLMGNVDDARE